jgi:hypothetical protein
MKTIVWDTNFNGKLDCNRFAHIDLAPEKMPTDKVLEDTVVQISVADKSHAPVEAKIAHIVPFRLAELTNLHTWFSHGMDTSEFINYQHIKKKVTADTMLALYYYKKVN